METFIHVVGERILLLQINARKMQASSNINLASYFVYKKEHVAFQLDFEQKRAVIIRQSCEILSQSKSVA